LRGHVAVAGDSPAAQLLDRRDRLLRRPLVEVVHHHRGTVPRQAQRDFSPDAPARARDDRHLPVELSHAVVPPSSRHRRGAGARPASSASSPLIPRTRPAPPTIHRPPPPLPPPPLPPPP